MKEREKHLCWNCGRAKRLWRPLSPVTRLCAQCTTWCAFMEMDKIEHIASTLEDVGAKELADKLRKDYL